MYYLNSEENFYRGNDNTFYEPSEGYTKGNMNKTTYYNYRNYEPKQLEFSKEQDKLLYLVSMYYFASHDLKLHLDLNPNDKATLEKFKEYVNEYKKYKTQYTNKYGPLCSIDNTKEMFEYIKCPWPWEGNK